MTFQKGNAFVWSKITPAARGRPFGHQDERVNSSVDLFNPFFPSRNVDFGSIINIIALYELSARSQREKHIYHLLCAFLEFFLHLFSACSSSKLLPYTSTLHFGHLCHRLFLCSVCCVVFGMESAMLSVDCRLGASYACPLHNLPYSPRPASCYSFSCYWIRIKVLALAPVALFRPSQPSYSSKNIFEKLRLSAPAKEYLTRSRPIYSNGFPYYSPARTSFGFLAFNELR